MEQGLLLGRGWKQPVCLCAGARAIPGSHTRQQHRVSCSSHQVTAACLVQIYLNKYVIYSKETSRTQIAGCREPPTALRQP